MMLRLSLACAVAAIALFAQSERSSALQGSVRDSQGKPVSGATVQLKTNGQALTALTDSQGNYRFPDLRSASYTVHASANKSGEADSGPFQLEQQETKKLDLTLHTATPPQFFDEPTFIVAGVTDPSLRGGHGSDPVLRSAESLAKSTAALRTGTSAADVAEKQGNPLEAAREFQRAAEREPSESNLFDWGTELLSHRAADQAVEVFAKGHRLFPRSTRTLLGLAVALYSRGSYDQAAQRFFEAADLDPSDPAPYLFLGKVSSGAITESDGFAERLERFAKLQPESAWANYYYAATLWKRRAAPSNTIQAMLEKAVHLDPHLGAAFLQLGIVFADRSNFQQAIIAYQNAIAADPSLNEAHYRLAQAHRKVGEPAKAKKEIELYQQLSQQSAQALERERAEIQQFVFELRDQSREKH